LLWRIRVPVQKCMLPRHRESSWNRENRFNDWID